jgi:acyl-CoA reductase-like NAD-dependent aldehyde dehydrogenase
VVPGPWDAATLRAQAESVAAMVTYNAGFNCVSARALVTPAGWRHRDAFLAGVEHFMALSPPRRPWYPGSAERVAAASAGRAHLRRVGQVPGLLPWTIVTDLDPSREDPAFSEEAFCPVLAETSVGSEDAVEYLARAVDFANDRLQGTLAVHLVVHPATLRDPALRSAVERAIRRLRYGTVAVNVWSAMSFALGTTPWGAFPGATLADARSGVGFVHNALMLEGVEKTVVRQPARPFPKPVYFPTHRTGHLVGRRLVQLEARGRLRHLPGVVLAGLRG